MKKSLLSLFVLCTMTFGLNAQVQNYAVGQTVADFTVTDVHGNTHNLSAITASGKWVVIDFFFTSCGPCQQTVPIFSELHQKYGCNSADLFCISIDTGDSDADVLAFEATYSVSTGFNPAPAVSGTEGGGNAVITAFGTTAYPTYCLIGPDMKLKNGDIWPISDVSTFETAFSSAGFNPAPTSCGLGLSEVPSFTDFVVYPNPAANEAAVGVNLDAATEVTVSVYTMVGALVATNAYNGTAGDNTFVMNTENLENGQYLMNVSFGNEAATQMSLTILK